MMTVKKCDEMVKLQKQIPVSIIVCTYNSESRIKDVILSLKSQTYNNIEIIVVDDGSTDNTPKIIEEMNVKYVRIDHEGLQKARNIGYNNASGEIVAYTDDDCICPKNWVTQIVEKFNEIPDLTALGGLDLTPRNSSKFEIAAGALNEFSRRKYAEGYDAVNKIKGCNMTFQKSILEKVGGFDASIGYNEERDMSYRLHEKGYNIIFDPDIFVWHERRGPFKKYVRYLFGAASESIIAILKNPELRKNWLFPNIIINVVIPIIFISLILVSFFSSFYFTLVLFLAALFYFLYRTFDVYRNTEIRRMDLLLTLIMIITNRLVYGAGTMHGLYTFLKNRGQRTEKDTPPPLWVRGSE